MKVFLFCQTRTYITHRPLTYFNLFSFQSYESFRKSRCHIFIHRALSARAWRTFGFVPLQKCIKKKKNHVFVVKQQEMETSLYFLNVRGLCCRENGRLRRRLWPIIAVAEGPVGKRVSMHERMRLSVERLVRWRWWPVLAPLYAGTLHSTWDAGGIYNPHCKSTSLPGRSWHVYKESWRGHLQYCHWFLVFWRIISPHY